MSFDPGLWAQQLVAGDRRTLARSITMVESTRPDHRAQAEALLDRLLPTTGGSIRLGITGTPGVGKSTFIDAFGATLIGCGHQVAVLAVDPTSSRNGGSILGDKTRMADLSNRPEAFIRPSPSGGLIGGVARRTRDALLVCEAAGYDIVIVETMGVGQAETAVAEICDLFLLLVAPGGGDELQGIKRGVMELADLVAVNKADGALLSAAHNTAADYSHALHLVRPKWPSMTTPVLTCSAITTEGIQELWATVVDVHRQLEQAGHLSNLRSEQAVSQLNREFEYLVSARIIASEAFNRARADVEHAVATNARTPGGAAAELARKAWSTIDKD